jgi:Asp-tRNA(Asn)/Glu-tRNA(Gln) amidotransferase A subunit family amidase
VQAYLNRIDAFDKKGPNINAMITVNAEALKEADKLDAAYKSSGPVGPLHGIPVIIKDQADVKGMPTTLGSLLFKDYFPDRDSFVAEKLKNAGAVILGKATLGELGGGDTHGSLFGSTRNPYDTERTVGGSSGGSAAAVAANYRRSPSPEGWRRSAGRQPGTASPACAHPRASSAAAASTAAGRKCLAPWVRWRAR